MTIDARRLSATASTTLTAAPRSRRPLRVNQLAVGAAAAGLAVTLAGAPAQAQEESSQGEFSVQRFEGAPGPRNFIVTRGARTDGEMVLSTSMVAHWGYKPLVIVSCETETNCDAPNSRRTDVKVVENIVTADLMASLTPIPRVQAGLRLPLTWVKGEGIDDEGFPTAEGVKGVGIGDIEIEGKVRALGEPDDMFVLGGALFGLLPMGHLTSKGNYMGNTKPGGGLRAIADVSVDKLHAAANVAGVWRDDASIGNFQTGPEVRFSAASAYQITPLVAAVVDFFGSSQLSKKNDGSNAAEVGLGARLTPGRVPVEFTLGAGTGVIRGVGAPKLRVFAGALLHLESSDRDGDGIAGAADLCPADAEDVDGYEDGDGCPDVDNDMDTIVDAQDKCPREPEDSDGFEDTDGCPDLDNDGDGVPDDRDACKGEPETKNGYEDEDGCPDEVDSDEDGVPDSRDECVDEPEDTDGFEDLDGCPDLDNDGDGVPDDRDECYLDPETINDFEDEDGCPDENPDGDKR